MNGPQFNPSLPSGAPNPPVRLPSQEPAAQRSVNQTINESNKTWLQNNKKKLNWGTNYAAAIGCGLSFALSNTSFNDNIKDMAQKTGFFLTKLATLTGGVVNADSAIKSVNPLALIGSILEAPPVFAPGHDLWLYRGFPLFGQNSQQIFSSIGKRNEDGIRETNKSIDMEFVKPSPEASFTDRVKAFFANGKRMLFEYPYIFKEMFTKFKDIIKSSAHIVCASTTSQMIGSTIALFGFKKVGSAIRNIGGIGVDIGLALHKEIGPDGKPKEKGSSYFYAGITWGLAAVIDFFKRFDFISEKINGLSELEYLIDRFASAFFADGGDDAAKKALQT